MPMNRQRSGIGGGADATSALSWCALAADRLNAGRCSHAPCRPLGKQTMARQFSCGPESRSVPHPLLLARALPRGEVAGASFLVDVRCLGVKNALHRGVSPQEWAQLVQSFSFQETDPACLRKLVVRSAKTYKT